MTQTAVAVDPREAALDPDARPPDDGAVTAGATPRPRRRRRTAGLVAGLTALVGLPLFVALGVVRSPKWYPSVDMALIEMRVRDVATSYNPVLGAGGRFSAFGEQGNHPGPLPYYVLTPVYRLFGSNSWALEAAAVSVALAAVAVGIWLAHRRAGLIGALAATLGYLVLIRIYGSMDLLSPWNPNVAIVWWVTLLLALWGVLSRDYALLPVAAFAAALCAQAHISYLGLAGGLAIVVGIYVAVDTVRNPPLRRPALRWLLVSVLLTLLLWAPPLYEQFQVGTGNLTIMWDSFTDPKDDPIRFATAWNIVIGQLDLTPLVGGLHVRPAGPAWTLLVLWALSVAGAVWLRRPWLGRLHVVTAAAMATSFIAIVRITGAPWWYLTLWARGTALLTAATVVVTGSLVGATLWARRTAPDTEAAPAEAARAEAAPAETPSAETPSAEAAPAAADAQVEEAAAVDSSAGDDAETTDGAGEEPAGTPEETRAERRLRRRDEARALRVRPSAPPAATARRLVVGLGVAIAVTAVSVTVRGAHASGFDLRLSRSIDALVRPTERALTTDGPRDTETLLTFTDPVGLGSSGFALMLALERDGYDVKSDDAWEAAVGDRRVTTPDDAERELHVSVGDGDIALWRGDHQMHEVADIDPRTPAQKAQTREQEARIVAELEDRGLEKQARLVESVRMLALEDPHIPKDIKDMIAGLGDLPQPVAVFISSNPGALPERPTGEAAG